MRAYARASYSKPKNSRFIHILTEKAAGPVFWKLIVGRSKFPSSGTQIVGSFSIAIETYWLEVERAQYGWSSKQTVGFVFFTNGYGIVRKPCGGVSGYPSE